MAKGRHLKPDFFTDMNVVSVSPLARLLYQGLWCYAADCGHLDDEPMEFKLRILPADNCDVGELLGELVAHGRITRQGGVIHIPTIAKHGRIDKRYETACDACKSRREHAVKNTLGDPQHDVTTTGKGSPEGKTRRDHAAPHPQHDADGDGDGDGDGDVSPSGIGAANATQPAPKRATKRPDDFRPSQAHIDLAAELGVDLRAEWPKFCDYCDANGKTYKDWSAALRNWIRNATSFSRTRPSGATSRQQADAEMFDRMAQRAQVREAAARGEIA